MISTKGRYGLRVMLELVQNSSGGPMPLKDIAERQEISKKYLEIIVKELVKGKLIKGSSGKGGGYMLCRPADTYSVGEIVELLEGSLASVSCLASNAVKCPRADKCPTLPIWRELDEVVRNFLYNKKLVDLVGENGCDPV